MSESDAPSSTDVLRSLRLLRSPDPAERRRGIAVLVALRDDPRVRQVFEHLQQNDPDPGVRDAAWEALRLDDAEDAAAELLERPAPLTAPPPSPVVDTVGDWSTTVDDEAIDIEVAPLPADTTPPRPLRRVAEPPPRDVAPEIRFEPSLTHDDLFLLNPSNAQFVALQRRRMARGLTAGCVRYLLAVVALVLAVALGVLVGLSWYQEYQLNEEGLDVAGEITNLYVTGDEEHRAVYRFEVGAADAVLTYFDEQPIEEDDYAALAEGDTVVVTYLPAEPATTRLQFDNPEHDLRLRLTIAAVGLLVLSLLLLILGAVRRRRARILPGGGRLVRGELVDIGGRLDDEGDYKISARYRFRSPRGKEVLHHHASQIRNDLRNRTLPAPGTPVAVVYKNDKSFSML